MIKRQMKVFLGSTSNDLKDVRAELRQFIPSLSFELICFEDPKFKIGYFSNLTSNQLTKYGDWIQDEIQNYVGLDKESYSDHDNPMLDFLQSTVGANIYQNFRWSKSINIDNPNHFLVPTIV